MVGGVTNVESSCKMFYLIKLLLHSFVLVRCIFY